MMDRKRHWAKLGAEEGWSDRMIGEQYITRYIPDNLDKTEKLGELAMPGF